MSGRPTLIIESEQRNQTEEPNESRRTDPASARRSDTLPPTEAQLPTPLERLAASREATSQSTPATRSPRPMPVDTSKPKSSPEESRSPMSEKEMVADLVRRAEQGDEQSLVNLKAILDETPKIWRVMGDLTRAAERGWILAIVGDNDPLKSESIPRRLNAMKANWAGPSPTPMQSTVVDQIGITWLAMMDAETVASHSRANAGLRTSHYRRLESAQRRFLSAINTLAKLRLLESPKSAKPSIPNGGYADVSACIAPRAEPGGDK